MIIYSNKENKVNFSPAMLIAASLLFVLVPSIVQAHYLWIDPVVYKDDDKKFVHLHFGEFHKNLIETKKTRLLDRKSSELKAYLPSKKESISVSLDAKDKFFEGEIETDVSGLVQLTAQDLKSPVKDWTKHGIGLVHPTYYARTQWLLYKEQEVSQRIKSPKPVMDLDILPVTRHINHRSGEFGPKTGEEMVFQVYFKQKPLDQKAKSVTVFAPNGWAWEAKLDKQNGIGRFKPIMPGTYVIEVIYVENTPGEFDGQKYDAVRHRATFSLTAR